VKALPVIVSADPIALSPGEKLVIWGAASERAAATEATRGCSPQSPEAHDARVCTGDPEQPREAKTRKEAGTAIAALWQFLDVKRRMDESFRVA
jgi:hypothetical protein